MSHDSRTDTTEDTSTAYGWCAWHENYARSVRLVRTVEQAAASRERLFACLRCCGIYDLVPVADQP